MEFWSTYRCVDCAERVPDFFIMKNGMWKIPAACLGFRRVFPAFLRTAGKPAAVDGVKNWGEIIFTGLCIEKENGANDDEPNVVRG